MNRQEFEHIVRAAAGITGEKVIGCSALAAALDASRYLSECPCRPWAALIGKEEAVFVTMTLQRSSSGPTTIQETARSVWSYMESPRSCLCV